MRINGGEYKMVKREPCCKGGVCPACDCCICVCTKDLRNALTPKARVLLKSALQ